MIPSVKSANCFVDLNLKQHYKIAPYCIIAAETDGYSTSKARNNKLCQYDTGWLTAIIVMGQWPGLQRCCLWNSWGLMATDAVKSRPSETRNLTSSFALGQRVLRKQRPNSLVIILNATRTSNILDIFNAIRGPQLSRWTWRRGHLVHGNHLSVITPSALKSLQSLGWYWIRGINWTSEFDFCDFNPYVPHGWYFVWVTVNDAQFGMSTSHCTRIQRRYDVVII